MMARAPGGKGLRWIFAHDHRFIPRDGEVFTHAQFESDLWDRYLAHCDELEVVGREGIDRGDTSTLRPSSHPGVNFRLLPDHGNPVRRFAAKRQFAKVIGAWVEGADGVIARLPSQIGLIALEEAHQRGIPCAVEVAGCAWDAYWHYGNIAGKLYAPIYLRQMQEAVRRADFAIYVTDEFLQSRYPNRAGKTASASNVVLPELDGKVLEQRLRHIGKDGQETLVFGTIATLRGRFKGIQTAFEALAGAGDALPAWTFRILGQGDPRPWQELAAKLGIADRVQFDRTLPAGIPVLEWLDGIDIYLQPSLKEGLPRALIEAMSRGLPAIGARTAGIPELLDPRWIVEAGNARQLQGRIIEMAGDRDGRQVAARTNYRRAGDFTSDKLDARRAQFWNGFAELCERARS